MRARKRVRKGAVVPERSGGGQCEVDVGACTADIGYAPSTLRSTHPELTQYSPVLTQYPPRGTQQMGSQLRVPERGTRMGYSDGVLGWGNRMEYSDKVLSAPQPPAHLLRWGTRWLRGYSWGTHGVLEKDSRCRRPGRGAEGYWSTRRDSRCIPAGGGRPDVPAEISSRAIST